MIIYRLVNNLDNSTIYIGKTGNLNSRYKQHKRELYNKYIDFLIVPICNTNDAKNGHVLEWYFIDFFRYDNQLLNKTNFFTRPISKELNLIDFCLKYSINHVEILDFSIYSK